MSWSCGNPDCLTCRRTKPPQPPERPSTPAYDEQLRLLGPDDEPAGHVPYTILAVTLTPPPAARSLACCATDADHLATDRIYVNSSSNTIATTSDTAVGTSVTRVALPEGKNRALTANEITMARTVFGGGVDYARVKVRHGGWWLFMGLQDENTAVTPNGNMYYPTALYREDFTESDEARALFMHEMAHV
ncbi:hypothetical protein [Zestomonas carbonaria]|uniref:DUF4157 domain-containing protein n=1 Tax=Zestomonas carbonaria TaxID=2762745 RepID=A0A7U7EKJ6_9GAMM|nr:hypothetical protein [Pseudomonas carbonaria]CAD5106699.1 hypothetical protein PSEWESI4_00966 [Pseudomonas carbonaria]